VDSLGAQNSARRHARLPEARLHEASPELEPAQ
jgi:hypothetical protein